MADVKYSALPVATSFAASDYVAGVQGGTTKTFTRTVMFNGFGIYSGSGAPASSPANGSLYLRTDGTASTTLYIRSGSAWHPLVSQDALGGPGNIGTFSGT
jgi:hypothetical protein